MIVGYNTDVKVKDEIFHVQTEDKGLNNPYIETLVYLNGEIIHFRRLSYAHVLIADHRNKVIKSMMKTQHESVIEELKKGFFSRLISAETRNLEEKSLDEMVLDYLSKQP